MTQIDEQAGQCTEQRMTYDEASNEREPTAAEQLAWPCDVVFLPEAEAAPEEFQYLHNMDDLPEPLARITELGDVNVTFVPRTRTRYFEYAPLFHLLPKHVLDMFGLPMLRGGQSPFIADHSGIDDGCLL
jgi:hypothetical protein